MLNLQSCTQKPLNEKKPPASWIIERLSASQNQASPAVNSGIVFTCGGQNCLHSGGQQEACRGTATRRWGAYAIWKVCACDFLIIAAYLFGLAGSQEQLQVNVTQISEGWRWWGQTSRVSQQKQGVSHTVKPSWRLNGKRQRLKGALPAGGSGQQKTPRLLLCLISAFVKLWFL